MSFGPDRSRWPWGSSRPSITTTTTRSTRRVVPDRKAVGAHAPSIVYRLLPLLAGVAMIPLLYWTESRKDDPRGRISGLFAAALGAGSFFAILYSSEARGYTPAAFFAVLAFAMVRHREMTTGRDRALFAVVCTLGLLSHLTFLFVYAGLAA